MSFAKRPLWEIESARLEYFEKQHALHEEDKLILQVLKQEPQLSVASAMRRIGDD